MSVGAADVAPLGEERRVDLPQGTLTYNERGSGPPIVFLHGLYVDSLTWRKVVPLLADRHRCITPNLPLGAHTIPLAPEADLSPSGLAQLVDDLLAALDLDEVTLVSNDTATALAQVVLTERPARIARAVLTAGDAFTNFLPYGIKPMRAAAFAPPTLWGMARFWNTRFGAWSIFLALTRRRPPRAIRREWFRRAAEIEGVRRDLGKFLRAATPRATMAAARRLRGFDRPVLLVWTRGLPGVFPVRHARSLARRLPDARVELVEDSFAFVQEDRPEALAALVGGFVPRAAS